METIPLINTPNSYYGKEGYTVIEADKRRLYEKYVLYCPMIIGISLFITLNGLSNNDSKNKIFRPDYISVMETIGTTVLLVALVFMFQFICHRKEIINTLPFSQDEKVEFKISIVFVDIMYLIRMALQFANVTFSAADVVFEFCDKADEYINGTYFCISSKYSVFIFTISMIMDIIGFILSVMATISIYKFVEMPNNLKKPIPFTSKMEKNMRNHFICCSLPIIFLCIAIFFISLGIIMNNYVSFMSYEQYKTLFIIKLVVLASVFVTMIGNARYVLQRKTIVKNFLSNKERIKYLISYIFQLILSITLLGLSFYLYYKDYYFINEPMDYVILTSISMPSVICLFLTATGIYLSCKSYLKKNNYLDNKEEMNYIGAYNEIPPYMSENFASITNTKIPVTPVEK